MADVFNFAKYIIDGCKLWPEKTALSIPFISEDGSVEDHSVTFTELLHRVSAFQQGLANNGFAAGDRIVVIIKPSPDLYALIIACFSSGLVPVFIDTGMGASKIKMAIEDSGAKAIVSMKALLQFFWAVPPLWGMQKYCADGDIPFCKPFSALKAPVVGNEIQVLPRTSEDHGLITFTSGSTGRPKGADRTHGCLSSQHLALKESLPLNCDDIGLSCFPVAALHQLACGVVTHLPRADLADLANYDPALVLDQIIQGQINVMGSAPAFLERLVDYMLEQKQQLLSIRLVIAGGSTVTNELLAKANKVFPNAELLVVYGSTESEPISHASYEELKEHDLSQDNQSQGYLVGKPVAACEVKVIQTLDHMIQDEEHLLSLEADTNQWGEIVVSGDHVLQRYLNNDEANKETKISRAQGGVWHRTGDFGFLDNQGHIWLVGRDKDLIKFDGKLHSNYILEGGLDKLPAIKRSALIQQGSKIALVIQPAKNQDADWVTLIAQNEFPIPVDHLDIYIVEEMPVDGRHASKVDRPLLREKINTGSLKAIKLTASTLAHQIKPKPPCLADEWRTPTRKAALGASALLTFMALLISQDSFFTAVVTLLSLLYFHVPVVVGGVLHMFVVTHDKFPELKVPIHQPLFGANKTWRGVIVVPLLTLLGCIMLLPLEWLQLWVFDTSVFQPYSMFALGMVGGLGYVLGELPNSFIKRRMGAAPGETPKQHETFFIALDQIDSGLGVALLYWLLLDVPGALCFMYAVTFPIVALVVKHYLFRFKLKDMAR